MGWWAIGPLEINGDFPADRVDEFLAKTSFTNTDFVAQLSAALQHAVRSNHASIRPGRELTGIECSFADTTLEPFVVAPAAASPELLRLVESVSVYWLESELGRIPTTRELCANFAFVFCNKPTGNDKQLKSLRPVYTCAPRLSFQETADTLAHALDRLRDQWTTILGANVNRRPQSITVAHHTHSSEVRLKGACNKSVAEAASDELVDVIHQLVDRKAFGQLSEELTLRSERFHPIDKVEVSYARLPTKRRAKKTEPTTLVHHKKFGTGTLVQDDGDRCTVQFTDTKRTLLRRFLTFDA